MSKQFTLAEFCRKRGITPEWLSSKEGYLKIDSRTKCLPDDELVVGGNLTIKKNSFSKFPERVVVGGDLTIESCDLDELPKYIEVHGDVFANHCGFKWIHNGCKFHQSVTFNKCRLLEITDFLHVHGDLSLNNCTIDTLPKGLVVDEGLYLFNTNIRSIPADCRCKELYAAYSQLENIPDFWSVETLVISGCPIREMPRGLRNLKYLDIGKTQIREINDAYPDVVFEAAYSQLKKLPDNWNAKSVSVQGCPIEVLPRGLKVTTVLNIAQTRITSIPDDCQVGCSIYAHNSKLKCVPGNLVLSGCLDVSDTDVMVIPSNVVCFTMTHNAGVQVDAYRFNMHYDAIDFHPNGQYICCDRILSRILEHKGNVWRCEDLVKGKEHFILTDGAGHYAHGETMQSAKADLRFKVGPRDISRYATLKLDDSLSFEEAYACYRTITGACQFGTDQFIQSLPEVKDTYTIREIIELTQGQYGHKAFAQFFHAA